jgi:hypothetical protein
MIETLSLGEAESLTGVPTISILGASEHHRRTPRMPEAFDSSSDLTRRGAGS